MDKSYVTMEACFICGEDTGSLLIDRRLKDSFEKHTRTLTVCDKCEKNYLSKGVLLMEAVQKPYGYTGKKKPEPTGSFLVMREEVFSKMFDKEIPEQRRVFIEPDMFKKIRQWSEGNGSAKDDNTKLGKKRKG